MLPNLLSEDLYLLLPSDLGALKVLVDALRLSEGIMELFIDLTLADLAKDALVGVVIALGIIDGCVTFAGVGGAVSVESLSRESARALETSV